MPSRGITLSTGDDIYILFDRSKGEHHAGEWWAIDDDEPMPLPEHPGITNLWSGSLSAMAHRLYLTGRYVAETLPPEGHITWLDSDNAQDLSLFDLLIICEPDIPFSVEEIAAVRNFVESGGSLLLAGGDDSGFRGAKNGISVLNDLLEGILGDEVSGEIRFSRNEQPGNGTLTITDNILSNPITNGPFGNVQRLSLEHGLRIQNSESEGIISIGPAFQHGAPLYIVSAIGRGRIAMISDSHLLVPGDTAGAEVDNITLTLNLIAYLVEDRYERNRGHDLSFESLPEIKHITEDGATILFETDRPAWSIVELRGEKEAGLTFRDLNREQELRIDGLSHDEEYLVSLYVYDGWGNGPLLFPSLTIRTGPRVQIDHGDVQISEVFWGGENQYIELYNSLDHTVDLRGWTLMDNQARYHLKGLIDKGDYYLLSRYDREGVNRSYELFGDVSGNLLLDPDGDFLILQDENGNVMSTANLSGEGWPAGRQGPSAASMERVSLDGADDPSNWDTALVANADFQGTPGFQNSRKNLQVFNPIFNGGVVKEGIRLSWEDNLGDSVLGINIYRSEIHEDLAEPPSAEYIRLNDVLIPLDNEVYLDTDLESGITYQYILGVIHLDETELFSEPVRIRSTVTGLPTSFKVNMQQNFPNPFNPQTEIKYSIKSTENGEDSFPLKAMISIFNVRGQKIRNLEEREVGPGEYTVRWDGRDDNGEPVSSGTYYYRLTMIQPGNQEVVLQFSKKMVLLR